MTTESSERPFLNRLESRCRVWGCGCAASHRLSPVCVAAAGRSGTAQGAIHQSPTFVPDAQLAKASLGVGSPILAQQGCKFGDAGVELIDLSEQGGGIRFLLHSGLRKEPGRKRGGDDAQ